MKAQLKYFRKSLTLSILFSSREYKKLPLKERYEKLNFQSSFHRVTVNNIVAGIVGICHYFQSSFHRANLAGSLQAILNVWKLSILFSSSQELLMDIAEHEDLINFQSSFHRVINLSICGQISAYLYFQSSFHRVR